MLSEKALEELLLIIMYLLGFSIGLVSANLYWLFRVKTIRKIG